MRKLLIRSLLALGIEMMAVGGTSAPAQAQGIVRLRIAPPLARVEVVPVAPSPRHAWIAGHWGWNGSQHVWVNGYYVIPPAAGYTWVPARWINEGGFWVFRRGHWAPGGVVAYTQEVEQPTQREVAIDVAPPPLQEEVIPQMPGRGYVWMPGHWRWDPTIRRHVWVPGHYGESRSGYFWVPAHWARGWRGWHFVPGYFRR